MKDKFTIELTRQELKDLWDGCGDAAEHITDKLEAYSDYSDTEILAMEEYQERLGQIEIRLANILYGPSEEVENA